MRTAPGDATIEAALDELEQRRYRDATTFVRLIVGDAGFPMGMSASTAADQWLALTSSEAYECIVGRRRWSAGRYETWIARVLEPIVT